MEPDQKAGINLGNLMAEILKVTQEILREELSEGDNRLT